MERKITAFLLFVIMVSLLSGCGATRYLTIINDTNQIINNVYVYVGEGTEIGKEVNLDEKTAKIEIKKEYDNYDTFTIELIDRYGLKYQKQVSNVALEGGTEVKITEADYVEQKGDISKKWNKLFNGD